MACSTVSPTAKTSEKWSAQMVAPKTRGGAHGTRRQIASARAAKALRDERRGSALYSPRK